MALDEPSNDDLSSDWESEPVVQADDKKTKTSRWKKVKQAVRWSPFVQTYKKKKYLFIQLAGHQGNFKPGNDGTILKKLCDQEEACLDKLRSDLLCSFVPRLVGKKGDPESSDDYLELEDVLATFVTPSVMDIKLGVRTFLEEELEKACSNPKLRKDMFEKMIKIDPEAPTEDEKQHHGITKARYMTWRDTSSSTSTLGFRIEGIKYHNETMSRDFKKIKGETEIIDNIKKFMENRALTMNRYLQRLKTLLATLKSSAFFRTHELIGTSLLFVHDNERANVWMIDFAKTHPIPSGVSINHESAWSPGNHEDGYLIGLNNIISIFEKSLNEML